MKTLFLVRHAKSSWKFEELSDHDRPLNKRGRADAALIGQELSDRKVEVDLIISSSAVRALTTATLIAKELEFPLDKIGVQEEIYRIDAEGLIRFTQALPDEYDSIMLIGHNPVITEVINALSSDKTIANLPTGGAAGFTFDCAYWGQISRENAKLLFIDYPKNYR